MSKENRFYYLPKIIIINYSFINLNLKIHIIFILTTYSPNILVPQNANLIKINGNIVAGYC